VQGVLDTENKDVKNELENMKVRELTLMEQFKKNVSLLYNSHLQSEESDLLRKELKKQKKTISVYELLMKLPSHMKDLSPDDSTHVNRLKKITIQKCPLCKKAFTSQGFLQSHMERRHKDDLENITAPWQLHSNGSTHSRFPPTNGPSLGQTMRDDDQVMAEVRKMKETLNLEAERLQQTEKQLYSKFEESLNRERMAIKEKEVASLIQPISSKSFPGTNAIAW
jgi:hypothetical protein